jgi:hypothetical protein
MKENIKLINSALKLLGLYPDDFYAITITPLVIFLKAERSQDLLVKLIKTEKINGAITDHNPNGSLTIGYVYKNINIRICLT